MADEQKEKKNFETLDSDQNLLTEFWEFLRENKKFWLLPIIIILLLFGLLILVGGSSAAPFIYTLF